MIKSRQRRNKRLIKGIKGWNSDQIKAEKSERASRMDFRFVNVFFRSENRRRCYFGLVELVKYQALTPRVRGSSPLRTTPTQ